MRFSISEMAVLVEAQGEMLDNIEAQVGEYLGEDDIIRLEDDFRRDETC